MLTIFPPFRAIMVGATYLIGRKVPRSLAATTWSKSATSMSCTGVSIGPVTPATLTRMSMRPSNTSSARATMARTSASEVTSQPTAKASRPRERTSSATASSGAVSRAASTTSAPSRASVVVIAAPMPFAAPVTIAFLPWSLIASFPRVRVPSSHPFGMVSLPNVFPFFGIFTLYPVNHDRGARRM